MLHHMTERAVTHTLDTILCVETKITSVKNHRCARLCRNFVETLYMASNI